MLYWNEIIKRIFSLCTGTSQTEIGDELGVSQDTVSRWATGKAKPGWEHIHAIAEMKGVTEEWLLTGRNNEAASGNTGDGIGKNLANSLESMKDLQKVLLQYELDVLQGRMPEETFREIVRAALLAIRDVKKKLARDDAAATG